MNIAGQYWSDHHERIYWIFLWESGFRKGLFFINHIWCVSFASATQGTISSLYLDIRKSEAGWTISPINSLSLIFYTEIFQVTLEIFPTGKIIPIKLQIKSPESFSDFQNHSFTAVKSVMVSLSWVHQFLIQHIFFLPGKVNVVCFPHWAEILDSRFASQYIIKHNEKNLNYER